MVTTQSKLLTEADVLALGSDARVEIVDGEVIEMPPVGMLHHFIAGNIYRILHDFAVDSKSGYVFMDGLICLLDVDGEGIRGAFVPDVCFIRKDRIPQEYDLARPFPGAPDLAVEVVSPNDNVEALLAKVRTYLNKGTEQVWVVFPQQQEVHQYIRDEAGVHTYSGSDTIGAEALLPGLELTMRAIFSLPDFD
jgi:Uma2 family endonuclease